METVFPKRDEMKAKLAALDAELAMDGDSWLDASPETNELFFFGEIGRRKWGGIDAPMFIDALRQFRGRHITLHLNTPGGEVDQGVAIHNAILNYKPGVTICVDGLAASMGSYILQAATRRIVSNNSMVMVHAPWATTSGDAESMRKSAEVLDKYGERMIDGYMRGTGRPIEVVRGWLSKETWFHGREIVDAGLASELVQPQRYSDAAARFPKRVWAAGRRAKVAAMVALMQTYP